jgi:hypothetical protein
MLSTESADIYVTSCAYPPGLPVVHKGETNQHTDNTRFTMSKHALLVALMTAAFLAAGLATSAVRKAQEADATAEAAPAEEGDDAAATGKLQRVTLKDGREIEGKVSRTPTGDIRIEAKYGILTFKADDVESVVDVVSPKDAYMERKSKIDTADADALVGLAQWVMEEHGKNRDLLKNAEADLEQAMKIKKDHRRAELLLRVVKGQLEATAPAEEAGSNGGTTAVGRIGEDELVTQRDIYNIRLQELRDNDRVTIKYQNDVLDRFIKIMRASEQSGWDKRSTEKRFRGLSRRKQVAYMLEQVPDNWGILQDILIQNDPQFMVDFRSKVWPILRRTAASAKNNYGANLMDGYQFKITASGGEKVDYTNYVIFVGYKKGRTRMVDRQKPEDSLILKAGLQETIDPKTDPRSVIPSYTMKNSAEYERVMEYIKSLKGPMEPNYRLEWKPKGDVVIDCDGKPDLPGLGE